VAFDKTIINSYYDSSYTYTYGKNIGDENFFTHLGSLMKIVDATAMFYSFTVNNTSYNPAKKSFEIKETETISKPWDKLEKADYMFANCSIDYLYLANNLFVGSPNNYGMTASHMFANSIKYYSLGSNSYGSSIG
jgi:hypothetical protein